MRSIVVQWLMVLLLGGLLTPLSFAEELGEMGKITGGVAHDIPAWFKESFLDIQDDVQEANASNKHVLLFFHLNNCPYCDKMLNDSFVAEPLQSYIKTHFDPIAININGDRDIAFNKNLSLTEQQLAKELKITTTPTILFLDKNNNAVVRLNGYRSAKSFESILKYVNDKAYANTSLADYIESNMPKSGYQLKDHSLFSAIKDFSTIKTPLAIIFEDSRCDECDSFHEKILSRDDVKTEMKAMTVVRLDADSDEVIIDVAGEKTTPKRWANNLGLTYRPGVILLDDKKEVTRIDGFLYSFHFKEMLRYVSSGSYKHYNSYIAYLHERQSELLAKGVSINIAE